MKIILLIVFFAFCGSSDARVKRVSCARCAYIDQMPFYAIITINRHRVCSGALISLKHVLTAAHCVTGNLAKFYGHMAVRTGTDNLQHGGTNHAISSIIWHKDFVTGPKIKNDIAVIILKTEIHQTLEQRPIALPTKELIGGKNAIFAGFGYLQRQNRWVKDVFQYYAMPVRTFEQCLQETALVNSLHEEAICTIPSEAVHTEKGDSGGALIQDGKVVGIASWANVKSPKKPVVFMNVYRYLDFINTVMSNPLEYGRKNPHSSIVLGTKRPASPSRLHEHSSKKPKIH